MKISWESSAKASLRQVARYINSKFGRKARKEFMQRVKTTENQLKRSPGIGQIDPLFEDRPLAYRSVIINGLNKLVYRVDDDTIHIVAFWDTRKEPTDEAAQTE